jgi:putative acetyltransferase
VAAGLTELRAAGTGYVVVIGHPEFYARHGFVPATRYGLRCEYPGVPEAAFRVSVLDSTLAGQMMGGVLRFRPEFAPAAEA